jgi:2-hydroxy-6-oxonona-2,4-dienedioate hydrolase
MGTIKGQTAPLRRIRVATASGWLHARTNNFPAPAGSPTVLLVHGLVISSRYMVPIAERLAARCRVYAVDLPGYGGSAKPRRAPSLPAAADAIADFMDALGIPTAHLLGNSYGCQVAAEFAVRHPRRLRRLILQGPTINPHERGFWTQLGLWLADLRYEPLWLNVLMGRDWLAAGLDRGVGTIRNALADRIEAKLPAIRAPTLVIRGGNDPKIPAYWAREAAALLPAGELRVIPGYGHCLIYTAPLELMRVIGPFLELEPGSDFEKSARLAPHQ